MGAGAGAGVSALTGGRPATGALIGGGIGAVGGAVTH
jgi:osmotically inducible lipoprotein OsmB